ncbi:MAG: hypothetical protein RL291_215 [Pseudomonadota bacterium]
MAVGAFAAVVRHGDDDAGAIFIKISRLDGQATLYGPAAAGLEGDGDRKFSRRHKADTLPDAEIEAALERERSFDPDLWVVEVEDTKGQHGLDGWLADL